MTKKNRELQERKNKFAQVHFPDFKAQTQNQHEYIRTVSENDITVVDGPSGCGKSFMAIGLACQYLIEGRIDNILYTRTIIGSGEDIGALPGNINERFEPYFLSGIDYFNYFLGKSKTEELLHYGAIKCYPIELLRGHTYHHSFMIADESQNITPKQLKLFLSRMGKDSKALVLGDIKQSDISWNGLQFLIEKFQDIKYVGFAKLDKSDILRHGLIGEILNCFEQNGV